MRGIYTIRDGNSLEESRNGLFAYMRDNRLGAAVTTTVTDTPELFVYNEVFELWFHAVK